MEENKEKETKEEQKQEDNNEESNKENEKSTESKKEENKEGDEKEKSLEDKYKDLEAKYNALLQDKVTQDRETKHNESYGKYDIAEENINLLKRYLSDKDDIEDELKELNSKFPHLFNSKKDTNINASLNVKDFKKEDKETEQIDTKKLGMVG